MQKRFLLFFAFIILVVSFSNAQGKFFTKSGTILFYSKGGSEKIEAINKTTTVVLDTTTGDIQFSVLMKGFEFEKALMMEHFNENYVESDRFPKSVFKGTLSNNIAVHYAKDGMYPAIVKGKLTLHGITKDANATGQIIIKNGTINIHSQFIILPADHAVKIPGLFADKISKTFIIKVDCTLQPLKG